MDTWNLTRRRFIQASVDAGVIGVLAACTPQGQALAPAKPAAPDAAPGKPAVGSPRSGGTLIFGLSSDPPNMDPHVTSGTAAMNVKMMVYNGLVRYWRNAEIVPDLAESWTIPDERAHRFKLRKGVTWHDVSDFTAQDVKASLQRILDPRFGATRRANLQDIKEIRTEDDHTVRLFLERPNAALIAHLARPECAILSKKVLESGADPNTTVIGTGPFRFVSREPGVRLVVEKNPNYFRQGLPDVARLLPEEGDVGECATHVNPDAHLPHPGHLPRSAQPLSVATLRR